MDKQKHALPPQTLRFMGEDDEKFISLGDTCVQMIECAMPLNSLNSILDIGCGYGRLAHSLWRNDAFTGTYYGFDILPKHIDFCKQSLSPLGDFNFLHLDIANARYNPNGSVTVQELDFVSMPKVDLVTFYSVFTHMYIDDIKAYLRHARSILNPNGTILFTAFLLENPDMLEETAKSSYPMPYRLDENCYYYSESDPLHAIGYKKSYLEQVVAQEGFVDIKFIYGSWSEFKYQKTKIDPFQDLCIAKLSG